MLWIEHLRRVRVIYCDEGMEIIHDPPPSVTLGAKLIPTKLCFLSPYRIQEKSILSNFCVQKS